MSTMDTRAMLSEIEGHLLLAATREQGRRAAAQFSAPLDWLTDCQRKEVERRFEEQYLELARASWQRTAERALQMRGEYEEIYRGLRRRLLAGWLLTCAVTLALAALVPAFG
ncbi:hypothetical protein GR925_28580 [Streptomyces sp. HUCO-GS316]|uniref:hypothetical protein n=1 Tax=Streptomyces sp. HUCO-GS316 TaxID=2692198 RepID=UPI001371FC1B|nr:hypothetical protein [Streptomyces sp. HUCO-GS316]MXM67281.1 hypothetical protein [Streptomyces sp. HUCO-GS316]